MKRSAFVLAAWLAAAPAPAQDLLAEAQAQYAEAAYEEALATLARAEERTPDRLEVHQYRAFCLIALGRMAEAERSLTAIVRANPTFVPSPTEVAPRVVALFADLRRKLLPGIARSTFADARTAFQEQATDKAVQQFELVMTLLEDPALNGTPEHEDLRVLTAGFLDLARARAKTAEPPKAEEPPAAAAPAPVVIEPPVVIDQRLPEWKPPTSTAAANRDFFGAIVVVIGADGFVKRATIKEPVYPLYDALLLEAARKWRYKPALKNGQPVESEKVVEVRLRGR